MAQYKKNRFLKTRTAKITVITINIIKTAPCKDYTIKRKLKDEQEGKLLILVPSHILSPI